MRPARFVTACFLYCGAVLLAGYVLNYRFQLSVESLAQLGVALSILFTGVYRLLRPGMEEGNPAEYGPFAYGMAILTAALTVLFVGQLVVR